MRFEPKDRMGEVIIFNSHKPCITVDLKRGQKTTLINLKLAHSGNNDDLDQINSKDQTTQGNLSKEKLRENMKESMAAVANKSENLLSNLNPKNELVQQFQVHRNLCCIILILSGKLFLEDCLLSLK